MKPGAARWFIVSPREEQKEYTMDVQTSSFYWNFPPVVAVSALVKWC